MIVSAEPVETLYRAVESFIMLQSHFPYCIEDGLLRQLEVMCLEAQVTSGRRASFCQSEGFWDGVVGFFEWLDSVYDEGCSVLGEQDSPAPGSTTYLLSTQRTNFFVCLKRVSQLFRNVSARDSAHQDTATDRGVHLTALRLLSKLSKDIAVTSIDGTQSQTTLQSEMISCVKMLLQMMCNIVTTNERTQAIVWDTLLRHSELYRTILSPSHSSIDEVAAMLILNTVYKSKDRCHALASVQSGFPILANLLSIQLVDNELGHRVDSVIFAVVKRIVFHSELDTLLASVSQWECSSQIRHSFFTQIENIVVDKISPVDVGTATAIVTGSCALLTEAQTQLSQVVLASCNDNDHAIKIVRLSCDFSAVLGTLTSNSEVILQIQSEASCKLVKVSLGLLESLSAALPKSNLSEVPQVSQAFRGLIGFKTNLIKILANLCYHNRTVQDEIRRLGGITVILSHGQIDDLNPVMREWSIFAIRNLCEQNQENQQLIQSLRAQSVVQNDTLSDLQKAGIDVQVGDDGKLVMSRPPDSSTNTPKVS